MYFTYQISEAPGLFWNIHSVLLKTNTTALFCAFSAQGAQNKNMRSLTFYLRNYRMSCAEILYLGGHIKGEYNYFGSYGHHLYFTQSAN
jgi:hypothetical protein